MKARDLNVMGTITGLYELKPGVKYLVLVDGKHFSYDLAQALLRRIGEEGIDLQIHVVATLHSKSIEIHEAAPEGEQT